MQALPDINRPPDTESVAAMSSCYINGTTEPVYLNHDILLHILALSSRREICTLMRTSRMFYGHGARYLLQKGVSLDTDAQIDSFMLFIVAGDPNRDPSLAKRIMFLRDLTLSRGRFKPEQISTVLPPGGAGMLLTALFQLLGTLGCLTTLTIYDSEIILDMHPELSDAISGLQTIRELDVSLAGPRTVMLLKALRSSLHYANISVESDRWTNRTERPPEDKNPMWLLQGSQHSLRSLSTKLSVSAPKSPQYLLVTHLSLSCAGVPQIQHYVHAFPNLRVLETFDCRTYGDDEEFEEQRVRNQSAQEGFGTWPSLRLYSGTILTLYTLGLRCSVRSVDINHFEEDLKPELLRAVLGDTRPERLKLGIDGGYQLLNPNFLDPFVYPGVEAVKHFELIVSIEPDDQVLGLSALLDAIVPQAVVPFSALVSFKLTFSDPSSLYDLSPSVESCPLDEMEEVLAAWDMEDFARRVQNDDRAPGTLQTVTMCIRGHRTRGSPSASLDANGQVTYGLYDDEEDD